MDFLGYRKSPPPKKALTSFFFRYGKSTFNTLKTLQGNSQPRSELNANMLMTCKDSPRTHFGVSMALAEALISMQSGLEVILRGFQQSNKSFEQIMT